MAHYHAPPPHEPTDSGVAIGTALGIILALVLAMVLLWFAFGADLFGSGASAPPAEGPRAATPVTERPSGSETEDQPAPAIEKPSGSSGTGEQSIPTPQQPSGGSNQ